MAIVRWIGKGFQLAGNIMSSDAFDEWIEAEGKAMLQKYSEGLTFGWFRGRARARKRLYKDIDQNMTRGSPLWVALGDELNLLPYIIEQFAKSASKAELLKSHDIFKTVVLVPRQIVVDIFAERVIGALEGSRDLDRFTAFPRRYLRRVCEDAESTIFTAKPPQVMTEKCVVLESISDMPWPGLDQPGGYFLAWTLTRFNIPPEGRGHGKRVREVFSDHRDSLDELKGRIGHWGEDNFEAALMQFCEKADIEIRSAQDAQG